MKIGGLQAVELFEALYAKLTQTYEAREYIEVRIVMYRPCRFLLTLFLSPLWKRAILSPKLAIINYSISNHVVTNDLYRPELAWIGTESNEFGTDEFMKWCEAVGTEPYLCLNFGTGTLDEGLCPLLRAMT